MNKDDIYYKVMIQRIEDLEYDLANHKYTSTIEYMGDVRSLKRWKDLLEDFKGMEKKAVNQ